MKHISRFFFVAAASVSALAVSGCATDDIDALQDRVDTLESQVSMLETGVQALNGNIEALSALAGGATINKVVEESGKYTITLTNGDEIVVNQGSVGVGYAPIMSVDADGFWKADYQDGKGAQFIKDAAGNKVSAKGADGITPKFGVDGEGFWTVSYDSGKTFEQVKDAAGKSVKAVASADAVDSYFADVAVAEDVFTLTLKSGEVYKVPVIKDFLVSIKNAETLQVFNAEEEKSYSVELKGVASYVLSAPQGWTASLSDALLKIKAPAVTKATLADMATDVSILAVSTNGYACVAKVHVQLDGSASSGTPTAAVTAGEFTYSTAAFSVAVENATSWTYLVRKSSETAPTVMEILTTGTAGTGTSIALTGLEEKTAYTVYVLPANGDKFGSVATASVTTAAEPVQTYEDNYTAYNEGKPIFIAGRKYTKAVYGEPVLLKATTAKFDVRATLLNGGVVFLEEAEGSSFGFSNWVNVTKPLVVVSRYTSKPVTLIYESGTYICHNNAERTVFKGVNFDFSARANYAFNSNVNTAGDFHFDGCRFKTCATKGLYYASNATQRHPSSVRIMNCYIELPNASGARTDFFSLGNTSNFEGGDIKEVIYDNNIFYSAGTHYNAGIALLGYGNTITENSTAHPNVELNPDITLTNNTFYGVLGSNCYIQTSRPSKVTLKYNIFWAPATATLNSYVVKYGLTPATDPVVEVANNIAFGKGVALFHTSGKFSLKSGNNATKLDDDPLADATPSAGDFSPIAAYKDYGAQR